MDDLQTMMQVIEKIQAKVDVILVLVIVVGSVQFGAWFERIWAEWRNQKD